MLKKRRLLSKWGECAHIIVGAVLIRAFPKLEFSNKSSVKSHLHTRTLSGSAPLLLAKKKGKNFAQQEEIYYWSKWKKRNYSRYNRFQKCCLRNLYPLSTRLRLRRLRRIYYGKINRCRHNGYQTVRTSSQRQFCRESLACVQAVGADQSAKSILKTKQLSV